MTDAAADLDRRVGAFESAWADGAPPDPAAFLPPPSDPQFLPVLAELVRVDLEFRRSRGLAADLDRYRADFPPLFADRSLVRELAFEEYRLRVAAGERIHPADYASRYGIDTAGWPAPALHPSNTPTRVLPDGTPGASVPFPEPGAAVGEYRLVSELGRGSFARVYLAEEPGLAGRRVAVKLSTRFGRAEPETLARLQHTHVVPVYSTHRVGPFQLVVMPFLGATTLADVLADLRGRGAWPASGRELADTLAAHRSRTLPASRPAEEAEAGPRAVGGADVVLRTLSRFSFPDAVLWIGARLADALAHAHDRGILHRDVKPANVLLTDDGQPMLLDFNLAADPARGDPRAGGTPAYMAPEQLRGLRGERAGVGPAADVYALGVVLFELLTGHHPFPPGRDAHPDPLGELLRLRSGPPPRLRALNPVVSPSAEAIVRRCLEPDPAHRYPSAKALAEDLDRQVANQPLAFTREPSLRERFRKWRRRHPRLASSGTVAALASVLVLVLVGAVIARQERVKNLEGEREAARAREGAAEQFQAFRTEARLAVPLFTVFGRDPAKFEEGERRVRELLARYSVTEDADWASRPAVALLPDADRLRLRDQVADILMTLARVGADRAMTRPPGPEREAGLNAALSLIDRAEAAYGPDAVPRSLALDRAEVLARLGRAGAAPAPAGPAAARDYYLAGTAALARGKYHEAARLLEEATDRDPRQFWAWFNLGVALTGLGRDAKAEGCFNAAIALEPDHPMSYFNRGLTRLNRGLLAGADADFTAALKLKPDLADALVNRAIARLGLNKPRDAEGDLTKAIGDGTAEPRLYFLRADARRRLGDAAGAKADRAEGLARKPTDEGSWIARGLARAGDDPAAALADFDEALKLNPRSVPALQNKAFVLDGMKGREADAVEALSRALEFAPDSLQTLAGRAVLLARKGDRGAAHRDADRCLGLGPNPDVLYQLAGVYALTSRSHPEDARTAYHLLADALKLGYGFQHLDADPDLAPLRGQEDFRKVVAAAIEARDKQRKP